VFVNKLFTIQITAIVPLGCYSIPSINVELVSAVDKEKTSKGQRRIAEQEYSSDIRAYWVAAHQKIPTQRSFPRNPSGAVKSHETRRTIRPTGQATNQLMNQRQRKQSTGASWDRRKHVETGVNKSQKLLLLRQSLTKEFIATNLFL
jgi:hypothetical protein